jgi:hypothetical protein
MNGMDRAAMNRPAARGDSVAICPLLPRSAETADYHAALAGGRAMFQTFAAGSRRAILSGGGAGHEARRLKLREPPSAGRDRAAAGSLCASKRRDDLGPHHRSLASRRRTFCQHQARQTSSRHNATEGARKRDVGGRRVLAGTVTRQCRDGARHGCAVFSPACIRVATAGGLANRRAHARGGFMAAWISRDSCAESTPHGGHGENRSGVVPPGGRAGSRKPTVADALRRSAAQKERGTGMRRWRQS